MTSLQEIKIMNHIHPLFINEDYSGQMGSIQLRLGDAPFKGAARGAGDFGATGVR
jgi:hypothetical protein